MSKEQEPELSVQVAVDLFVYPDGDEVPEDGDLAEFEIVSGEEPGSIGDPVEMGRGEKRGPGGENRRVSPGSVYDVYAMTGGTCTLLPENLSTCSVLECRHHLDCQGKGTWKESPASRPAGWDTCSLRIAERGPLTLEEIGGLLGLTRERVRQIEVRAVARAGLAVVRSDVLSKEELGSERFAVLVATRRRSYRGGREGS